MALTFKLWNTIAEAFRDNLIVEDRYQLILNGLMVTLYITVFAIFIGTILGGLICWMRMNKNKGLRNFAIAYIDIMRGTPVLVLLMIMYYVVLAPVIKSGVIVAIITFAMNFSAYFSEMLRSGIEQIDRGQTEAGLSLGFSKVRTFLYVIVPQLIRNILPVYQGEMISILKSTSIVGYIAIVDMTKASDIIRSRTFDAFFPLIAVALLYFLVAWLFGRILRIAGRMKAKIFVPALILFMLAFGVYGYNAFVASTMANGNLKTTEEIIEKGNIALMEGSIYDIVLSQKYPNANFSRVKSNAEAAAFVLSGKADAMTVVDVQARYIIKTNPDLIETDSLFLSEIGAGFPKGSPLTKQFNEFLAEFRETPEFKDMVYRWTECDIDTVQMKHIQLPQTGQPLVMGVTGTQIPLNCMRGEECVGLDIELGEHFAQYLNRPLKLEITTFQGLIPDLATNRIDLAISDFIITEERAKKVDFSDPYFSTYAYMLVSKTAKQTRSLPPMAILILIGGIVLLALFFLWKNKRSRKQLSASTGESKDTGDSVIKVSKLHKIYGNSLEVLKGVDAEIKKGEVISIIGPSGTGKSTFLRCLNLLETPTDGSILIDGEDILSRTADVCKLRQRMGMVFQSFNLFNGKTILDNITLAPTKLLGKKREEAEKEAMQLLEMVGLADKAGAMPSQLSGGQKQRVAIARALAMHPEILLFDEPTSALDPTMVSEVLSVMRALAKRGLTMVIVTHEMRFARDVSSRVFYMDQGIVYEENTPEELFDNPQKELTRIFINRIRETRFTLDSDTLDYYGLMRSIISFGEKYGIPIQTITNMEHAVEELTTVTGVVKGSLIAISYSEKESLAEIRFEIPEAIGRDVLDKEENGLSKSILLGITSSFDWETEGDTTTIRMKMK